MFNSKSPDRLFLNQLHTLQSHLPGVREGDASSVHDSRVATRRIREILQLASGSTGTADELRARLTTVGKSLGRVRDADVRIELIADLEARIPQAAPWLVTVRQAQQRTREGLIRRSIKQLEQVEVESLLDHASSPHAPIRRVLQGASRTGRWQRDLCRMIVTRARTSTESIAHATGVYFPNRVHGVRIGLKKLRYVLEIGDDTGIRDVEQALRDLKKAQDILGDLHDRQTLLDDVCSNNSTGQDHPSNIFVTHVTQVVEAETHKLHERYLARRERLLGIANELQAIRISGGRGVPALLTAGAGVVALSSFGYALRRHRGQAPAAPRVATRRIESRAPLGA